MSDYLTNLIGQQRPRNTVPVPTPTPAPKLLPNSLQDAGNELLGNLGIAGRGLVQGAVSPITMVADPLTEFVNKTFGAKQKLPSQAVSEGLTAIGVPQAKDDAQRVLEAATGGLAGGGAIAKTAQLAGKGAGLAKGYLDTIGKDLAGQMTSGLGSGAGSVGASQAATASGASPVVAQLAGLGGGIVGGGARPVGEAKASLDQIKLLNTNDLGLKSIGEPHGSQYQVSETSSRQLSGSGQLRGSPGLLAQPGGAPAAREADGSLQGLPRKGITAYGQEVIPSAHLPAHDVARDYMIRAGLEFNPPKTYQKVVPDRARAIAAAFDAMPHDPQNPEVAQAYDAMAKETLAQYQAIKNSGVKFEFLDPSKSDPYHGNPREMTEDVRNNNHMWVFPTDAGFGSNAAFNVADNPLLAYSGESWNGKPATINDIFRGVHDYFGHVKEGVGFRADGEENAWRSHSSMYSPLARKAMTTETRGQNSWVNYGPHGENNRNAKSEDTQFADQKIGILPDWVVNEGAHDPNP